jgi:RHS repeat-associated protein
VQDGLGNITAVIDQATGRSVARYDYGPFGEPLAESGEVDACPFRWQTKWYDAESQHYYFGYRHYDPRFGRWLSRDPLGEAGGFNLYAYCGNDPVNRHDPLGLAAIADDPVNPFGDSLESYRKQIFGMRKDRKDRKDREQWEGTPFSAGLGDGFKNIPPGFSLTIKQGLALSLVPAAVILAPMVAATAGEATFAAYVRVGIWAAGEGAVAVQTATVVGGGLLAFQCQDPATRELLVDGFVAGGPGGVISVEGRIAAIQIRADMLALRTEFKALAGVQAEFVTAKTTQMEFGFVQAVERQTVARDFYRASTGWDDTRIASHLRGIDFSQPVGVVNIQAGTSLTQYNLPGRVGNYFAPAGTPANSLGIYTSGLVESSHTFGASTPALRSTAASVIDDWSMSGAGWRIETGGGGTQFFAPNR